MPLIILFRSCRLTMCTLTQGCYLNGAIINHKGYCELFICLIIRSKSADLAAYILQKKDLGCTLAKSVTIIEETKQAGLQGSEFWKLLGGNKSYASKF